MKDPLQHTPTELHSSVAAEETVTSTEGQTMIIIEQAPDLDDHSASIAISSEPVLEATSPSIDQSANAVSLPGFDGSEVSSSLCSGSICVCVSVACHCRQHLP